MKSLWIALAGVAAVGAFVYSRYQRDPAADLAQLRDNVARANSEAGADVKTTAAEKEAAPQDAPVVSGPLVVVVGPDGKPLPHAPAWLLWKDKSRCVRVVAGDDARIDVRDATFVAAGDFPGVKAANGFLRPAQPDLVEKSAVAIDPRSFRTIEAPVAEGTWMEVTFTGDGAADVDPTTGLLLAASPDEFHAGVAGKGAGAIVFTGLDASRTYALFARAPTKKLYAMESGLAPGRREKIGLHEGKDLSAQLVLPGGVSVRDADVVLEFGEIRMPVDLDKDAGFRVAALPPSQVTVAVSLADGPAERFRVLTGSATVLLEPKRKAAAPAPRPAAAPR